MKHIELLKSLDACIEAVECAKTQPDLETAWNNCKRSDWMLWLDGKMDLFNDRDRRLMACAFVRRTPLGDGRVVWDLLTDERSRNAVEVAERYANGDATDDELSAAWNAAKYAAKYAAGSAAKYAAWSAAWSAAGSVEGSVVRNAAWSAQSDIIREFGNPFIGNEKRL